MTVKFFKYKPYVTDHFLKRLLTRCGVEMSDEELELMREGVRQQLNLYPPDDGEDDIKFDVFLHAKHQKFVVVFHAPANCIVTAYPNADRSVRRFRQKQARKAQREIKQSQKMGRFDNPHHRRRILSQQAFGRNKAKT